MPSAGPGVERFPCSRRSRRARRRHAPETAGPPRWEGARDKGRTSRGRTVLLDTAQTTEADEAPKRQRARALNTPSPTDTRSPGASVAAAGQTIQDRTRTL